MLVKLQQNLQHICPTLSTFAKIQILKFQLQVYDFEDPKEVLQNVYLFGKLGADRAENGLNFANILPKNQQHFGIHARLLRLPGQHG